MNADLPILDTASVYRVLPPPPPPPAYRLFTHRQVVAVALFVSPMLGGIFLALNRRRRGQTAAAWTALATGVAAAVAFWLASRLYAGALSFIVGIAGIVAVYRLSDADEDARAEHLAAGGRRASWWTSVVLPIGLVVLVLVAYVAAVVSSLPSQ